MTTSKAADLHLSVEMVGCPTVCLHCWAQGVPQGVPYQAMPLADIVWLLEEVHRFCDAKGLTFDAYPMHEVAAHTSRGSSGRPRARHPPEP